MDLKQIVQRLNAEFSGEIRQLIFWYDVNAEFVEEIFSLELANAKVYNLESDNQFYTKYFLERIDLTSNYLIYAPFPKPHVRDNHLEDTMLYSKQFFADRASLLTVDLGIDEKFKPVIQKYIKFFGSKDRTQRFYDLEIENFTKETIEVAIMSVLCKTRTASFDELVRVVLTDSRLEDNIFLAEFEKYDLLSAFWLLCEEQFGYTDVKLTLEKLLMTLFVSYTGRFIRGDLPKAWAKYASYKSGNIIAFLDNLMNNLLYRSRYDELSDYMAMALNAPDAFKAYAPEALLNCDTFPVIDTRIISWIQDRLMAEDTGAKLNDMTIPDICRMRSKKHFGEAFQVQYQLLEHGFYLIQAAHFSCPDDFKSIVEKYCSLDCLIDTHYRYFYNAFGQLTDNTGYENFRALVENIYANVYLSEEISKWNTAFCSDAALTVLPLQRNFYSKYVDASKDRVVVIISDAMRYETGRSLFEKLQGDANCTAKMEAMIGVLPSYTRLGMAALLPHKSLEMTGDYKVLVDGMPCDDLKQRETILKKYSPNSCCVQFDTIRTMKQAELRTLLTGMSVVYVYHNQIDARGDKANTENEVFSACQEAIEEIFSLIKRLSVSANTYHFIVTADHGFIYKRDKLQESDKISNISDKDAFVNRRFIVSDAAVKEDGICSIPMSRILGNDDKKFVSFPLSSNVFKVSGGGQNYVHGGSSPQEMIIPVIDVKTEKGHVDSRPAQIMLVSMVQKITNLITTLDFIQSEPVSDVIKATSYKIFFISEDNEKISNENVYMADRKDIEPQKRIFRLRFNFKNKKYDKSKRFYLVAYDEKNDLEVLRHEVVMDVAFANDYGF